MTLAFDQEVNLSQAANEPEIPFCEDGGDDDTAQEEVEEVECRAGNVHSEFLLLYSQMVNTVNSAETLKLFKDGMHELHGKLLQKASAGLQGNGSGTASFPQVDSRRKDKRQKTPWSASKPKKTRKFS